MCVSSKAMTKNAFLQNGGKHNVPLNEIRKDDYGYFALFFILHFI